MEFCALFPNIEGAGVDDDAVLPPNENADLGASAGLVVAPEAAAPKGDEVFVACAPPNGEDDDAAGAAPKGEDVVALGAPPNGVGAELEVLPKLNADFGASAGLLVPFAAPPNGDGAAAGVVDGPPKTLDAGVLLGAPNGDAGF